ncbi:hypothetical protein [Tunturiibacter gelidoferens]|uniref:Uncharacterized protein n=3 Tax=Tunturiibacter TaxID=3154218 RepID=A0A7Y9NK21_9BACT|nr:hypothetical protein [Edaphobacter lichenicola]MBB5339922.1 hypothetical protein [Edaphobacter lichenicola]NYF50764.1 hypothetical protein [Edaphobacter lichenicola]
MLARSLTTKSDATDKMPLMLRKSLRSILLFSIAAPSLHAAPPALGPYQNDSTPVIGTRVLTATEAAQFLPATVFFRGQSAPIQARNSGGVQFTKDALLLVALVDTAGYSSSVQEKYQAYLITEASIDIQGHQLQPGAYGCGFVAGSTFVVMDIGGHDLFSVPSAKDATLRRPTPLQILPGPDSTGYRLYIGRDYAVFAQAPAQTSNPTPLHP